MTLLTSQTGRLWRMAVLLVLAISTMEISSVVSYNIPKSGNRLEGSNSHAKLNNTNATFQATQLFLYRQKTELSLQFLNKVLPTLQSIQKNMTVLYNTSAVQPLPFTSYKQTDDALDNHLKQTEKKISGNRGQIQRYVEAYEGVERELTAFHSTLGNILFQQPIPNLMNETEIVSTTSQSPFSRPTDDATTVFDCSGALISNTGSINYKLSTGEELSQHESCVWTLTSENLANLIISLKAIQFQQDEFNFIAVGYFDPEYTTFFWRNFDASSPTSQTLEIPSPVVFIHLVTSPGIDAHSKGFHLEFKTSIKNIYDPSHRLTHFLQGSSGSLKYPLFVPDRVKASIVVQPSVPGTSLTMKSWDLNLTNDTLTVWMFSPGLVWKGKRFNGTSFSPRRLVNSESPRSRNSPYIVVYTSDGSGTYGGFKIEWGTIMS